MNFKNHVLLVAIIILATNSVAQNVQFISSISTSTISTRVNLDSIIQLTYQINPSIAAAKYDLEAAEYAYQEFERELSQFTPLKLESSLDRSVDKTTASGESRTQAYSNSIGIQKDYFNGTSVSASVGHQGNFGENDAGNYPFLGISASIPLFSSYQTLSRITWRSFEENQLYTTRLDYIGTIKGRLRWAQLGYLWFQNDLEKLRLTKLCWDDFQTILHSTRVQSTPAEKEQMEGELQSLQSDIVELDGDIHSGRIELQANIGCDELGLNQIDPFDLYTAAEYYGKEYLLRSKEELTKIAIQDDVEIRVLENSKYSAELKRTLAEKGKWDVFLNLNTNYDFSGQGTKSGESGYYASAAVSANWIDTKLLKLSYNKAEAEIKQYLQRIRAQQMNIKNSVDLSWNNAKNLRKQAEELTAEVESRTNVYAQKLASFLEKKETVDNLIQVRKKLLDSQKKLANVLTDFYETVTELDAICNVYFQKLKIDIVALEKKKK